MADLPSGTITLVFTDIEASTALLHELGSERYGEALDAHRATVRTAFSARRGVEVDTQGDAFFYVFESAREALQAAADAQHALAGGPARVRIGIHSGEPLLGEEGYFGIDVHRAARVMAAGHGGQILVSETTQRLAGNHLELFDLGLQRLKDMTAPERLYQLGEGEFPPLRTLNQTNLPVASNPLLGRSRELDELTALVEDGAQMVTITGAGGTGKTRLALQLAAELVERFADGVFWVPLAGLGDPEIVLPSIAQVLGAQGDLDAYLRDRHTLILLDNLEHLLEAGQSLARLLAAAPGLRLLVTSRSPLRLEAEREYPLDPLPEDGAVELLVERARQTGGQLEASDTLREICRRLDNLPLAVELAAGRAKLLGPEALLARLDQRLPLLTGGRRDLPDRQRTLEATIDWSHDLLGEDARVLFAALSVFAGSFPLEAAESICSADLDALADLVDLSLLKPAGDGRFLMLETIREYATARLDAREDAVELRGRHAEWFLALAEQAEDRMYAHGQAELFESLEGANDNLRTALDWFRSVHATERELRLAAALQDFWIARGHGPEGYARLESALARSDQVLPALRAKALDGAAWLAVRQGDYEAGDRYGTESLAIARSLGDVHRVVTSMSALGAVELQRGNYDRARALCDEALAHARATEDDLWCTLLLGQLGDLALNEGAYDDAENYSRECAARAESAGDQWSQTVALLNAGYAKLGRGEPQPAASYFVRALELGLELGTPQLLGVTLDAVAAVAAAREPAAAARLIGRAQATLDDSGDMLPLFEARVHDESIEALRDLLGPDELARLEADGRRLELDEAAALALELAIGLRDSTSRPT